VLQRARLHYEPSMHAHHWCTLVGGSGWLLALLAALPFCLTTLFSGPAAAAPASGAALALVAATAKDEQRKLLQPFSDAARSDWSYVPRRRAGIAWKEMSRAQRDATTALLRTALSDAGLDKVRAVMALEIALRELETFGFSRDPENYALALFGTPAASGAPWGWRIEGHHLSLHFTLEGDRYVATLPQFFGANPARVPRDIAGGPKKNTRVLGREEDLARELMAALSEPQRKVALFASEPYGDIVTKSDARPSPLTPVGVRLGELAPAAQAALLKLITAFAEHLRPELAEARLTRVRAGGLDDIRFGWAGSQKPGEPYYYRIQGKAFIVELDNSGGNHIHSVWRDFQGDWGRDILREHYAGSRAPEHDHGQR
jgi:uncharacterized protein DUF3500